VNKETRHMAVFFINGQTRCRLYWQAEGCFSKKTGEKNINTAKKKELYF
jgi:hypothetical protein